MATVSERDVLGVSVRTLDVRAEISELADGSLLIEATPVATGYELVSEQLHADGLTIRTKISASVAS